MVPPKESQRSEGVQRLCGFDESVIEVERPVQGGGELVGEETLGGLRGDAAGTEVPGCGRLLCVEAKNC